MGSDKSQKTSPRQAPNYKWNERLFKDGKELFPGLLASVTVAIAAQFLSNHYGGPTMLFALLLGMGFHFLSEDKVCACGIEFASKKILQFGVGLLGLGVTIDQVKTVGWGVFGIVFASVIVTMASGPLIARAINRGWRLGLLTGGAVAICGASAALAIASVLPKNKFSERNTIFTIISVTTLSTIAMIGYPIIVKLLEMDDISAGIFIGATIHDVAQVVGAGYSISEQAGDTATLVKLLRVAMLIPVVLILSIIFRNDSTVGDSRRLPVPLFVIGFVALVVFGSSEWFPTTVRSSLLDLSRWCLVVSISAIGMKTALKSLKDVGGQAILLICLETIILASVVLGVLLAPKFF